MWAVDFETWLITPARQVPPPVCMSFARFDYGHVSESGVLTGREGIQLLEDLLRTRELIVGAETSFEILVSVFGSGERWHKMLTLWVAALEAGLVEDVLTRQKSLDLAAGGYRLEFDERGFWRSHKYNLRDVASRHCDMRLDKENAWRKSYGLLAGVPISQYPKDAYDYSLQDGIATALTRMSQERQRFTHPKIQRNFPGRDPFADQRHQMIATVPLKAMSAYGLRTDKRSVERFAVEVAEMYQEHRTELEREGLVYRKISRDTDAIAARCSQFGVPSARKDDLLDSGDPWLAALAHYLRFSKARNDAEEQGVPLDPAWVEYADKLAAAGLIEVKYSRNTKAAARRCADAYAQLNRPAPRTDTYDPNKHGEYECIALDSDACAKSEDPVLSLYAEYSSLAKTMSTDIPMLRAGADIPIHTRFESLLETGRTSSSKPNVQNVRRLPGIRECFIPRPDFVFLDADYPMLELHTLAQVCYWQFGWSTLGDALKAGDDPHLRIAETILGRPYDEIAARRKAGDGVVDNARTAGKGVNFGAPGGLGKATFAQYAWRSYKIKMTEDEAQVLINQYKQTWPEVKSYFRWINSLDDGTGSYNVIQPWSQRLRAGATYCSACNSPFQGLGADVAKVALWLVWKATVGVSELGFEDPLYGCHMVNFVHDSIMIEVPEDRINAAAARLKYLMHLAAVHVMPDVGMREIDVLATRQWSKKAKAQHDEFGNLIPWDLREACTEALQKALEKGEASPETAYDYLTKKEWPRDVSRDVISEVLGSQKAAA